jgi:serine phosphatase RsbU (regulator of sigma subunit)
LKQLFYILFFFITPICLWSQDITDKVLDLQAQLNKASQDSTKVRLLNQLSETMLATELERSMAYAYDAAQLAGKSEYLPGLAEAYRRLGICFYYKYEFDSTLYYYQKSQEIYTQLGNQSGIAGIYKNIGLIYHVQGDYNQAINNYNLSLNIYQELGDKNGIARCRNDIGAVFYDQGNYEKALENYFEGLKLSEELGQKTMMIATMANIGAIYQSQEKLEHALSYYYKANKLASQENDAISMADTYRNIGGIYDLKHQFDSVLIVYEKALRLYQQLNDKRAIVVLYNFFGQVYVNQYETNKSKISTSLLDKAESYFQKSLELNKTEIDEPDEMCSSYQGLGDIANLKQEYNKTINYVNQALKLAEKMESARSIRSAYQSLAIAYAGSGNFKKAYESHLLFKNWNDSLKKDENVESLTKMSMQYSFDKEKGLKELEYQQKQKRDRLIRIFILIGLFLVSVFSIQVLRSYQRKKKDNILLEKQKAEIEKQKEEITDSIKYAKRIQTAILPSKALAEEILPEHFILFRPRDIVSGDYYWMHKSGNKVIVVAADCTGHGVPGAFMSMLGVSFLNEIVHKNNLLQPDLILNMLRESVKRTLGQTGKEGEAKDGMDVAMVVIDFDTMTLQYAGAYNPLYLFRNGELIEIKADKMPIGIYIREKDGFTNHELPLQKGDTFYIFSDGYHDQFGGPTGSKYKSIPFKEYLGSIQDKSMAQQRDMLDKNIEGWKGNLDQTDDIIVIGVRI